ncbi:MAG: hypothetical protein K2W91_13045 [Novosphingobium sp.]|nr:hypothetical protein [Novosphingobium sp.]
MMHWNHKALSLTGTSLALAGILALSACNSKDSAPAVTSSNSASAATAATDDPAAAASESSAAEAMHNGMEADQRQKMDHDNMRRGPGMNNPAAPTPSPQPTATNSSMSGGGMQDM